MTASSLSPDGSEGGTSPVAERVTLGLRWAVIFPDFSLLSSAGTTPDQQQKHCRSRRK